MARRVRWREAPRQLPAALTPRRMRSALRMAISGRDQRPAPLPSTSLSAMALPTPTLSLERPNATGARRSATAARQSQGPHRHTRRVSARQARPPPATHLQPRPHRRGRARQKPRCGTLPRHLAGEPWQPPLVIGVAHVGHYSSRCTDTSARHFTARHFTVYSA